ncbi:hypothetical protein ACIA8E_07390 [Streptomyces sp. NPDC051664]|uniref:hypothetical protein n=1 Tax=Streptomyces sp. NPDC051664 TaxID=3365668 RepID=UPI0037A28DAE
MSRDSKMIQTRVCIDDMLGPFDCKLNPANRWNGWLSPYFTLDTTRELSAQTLRMADEYGYDCVDTIHVIDGREDSQDTVHIIEGGTCRYNSEDEREDERVAIAVRIRWRNVGRDAVAATTITHATPGDRKAARRRKVTGRGAQRSVVVHARWQWLIEGSDAAADVSPLSRDGLYGVGGWEWTWHFSSWWCVCGECMDWHELRCDNCDLHRDSQPPALTGPVVAEKVGTILRTLAPEATSALVDFNGPARLIAVFAGDTEIDTADDTGPFDTETLGEADTLLRQAHDRASRLHDLIADWEHVPDERTTQLYRVTFPAL